LLKNTAAKDIQPGKLDFELTGDTAKTQSLLMQRCDGTFLLAVQSDEPVWIANDQERRDLTPKVHRVQLRLPAAADVTVHDVSRDTPVTTVKGASVDLDLGEHLLLVEIRP